ncbi:aminoacyl-tRNA deacylase [Saccharomonospora sp. CUA-673]|uniref:YbaK/EbsC family protein n=1 Tax=Saccharomonospora sp. CUA-673 TaxID=1904969 RepID=UPI00095EC549|nr:YbaK/EbsC family protein [Saccharomonospora sp. CUA-673]OLT45120.1 aminoacyl-tRNA deacylase [Saccharomonospora sp. CUA-673]
MSTLDHPSVAKVAAALSEADQDAAAQGIRILPADARTAELAAAALGVEVGAIANSLVFRATFADAEVRALLALTSGAHRANTDTLAALVGATEVGRADPEFVKEHTGQAIGGVAPIGHPQRLLTLVDTALAGHPVVWAAAGHPKSVYPTTFDDLLAATSGTAADVSAAAEAGRPR